MGSAPFQGPQTSSRDQRAQQKREKQASKELETFCPFLLASAGPLAPRADFRGV